jgi:CheY-like chemotaxis protein
VSARTVLVVDDDPSLRTVLNWLLEGEGFAVLTASNGGEALNTLEYFDGTIHAIVLDIHMPEMDGPTFYRTATQRGHTIPTLLVSSDTEVERIANELGVTLALEKPFTLDAFRAAIRTVTAGSAAA